MKIDSTKIKTMTSFEKIRHHFGSQTRLANELNVTRSAVSAWKRKKVPANRVLAIYRLSKGEITPHEMRPDLYPDSEWRP
tara:strand:- start:163 stop:402 length:240 start_codon:yes stop_codon:yes gene_type:complete